MALRFGYALMRVRPDDRGTDYETLVTEEVAVDNDDELRQRALALRDWTAAHLAKLRPDLALFYTVYGTLDDDGEPSFPLSTAHVAWEGRAEIALSSLSVGG